MRFLMPFLLKLLPSKPVFAHCDIPCGIYDPHTAQLASQTVLKMVQKMKALPKDDIHSLIRMVSVKEDHAELCKREILILWTDYFKSEHLEKFPDLHELVWKACKLCSDNKRAVDEVKAQELVEAVDKIADIFNETSRL
ncbi:superoxide dismutase, Ni [Candidatus Daviesbacteria bacterium RIFCSPLOWO2_01_FULL_38_10]|nr:MAG: superoxide dismutase, Ni [Candidatus Daviesbacteria bacterium RIFCSPHIGHO2_02_FULL_39_41]OGE39499.1 MAG: superoxide dismutase, Ni [Candidatus Daviesbacteria bacterium RIFCSPLOWO2_01_FULL_38_10]OGE45080.1 MAG: superoxide dismutase, Ni [Candidatus Daviesbacteria bacterium RIFCSPHIGHO2_12_FULL_38_25]OGE68585.1 MAG: superoxide dismutase, Ni [Candidatus Daviesbacteria bacterium RIFCSPLOWO2_02_FULL_38_18]OGE73149.1 MAG: superoxide dismutase, Ni [Candidatus Daviesbacteria bacterium RIFCSPLOWO2